MLTAAVVAMILASCNNQQKGDDYNDEGGMDTTNQLYPDDTSTTSAPLDTARDTSAMP